jgi:NitT/TauT family transport system ATP-binding protein
MVSINDLSLRYPGGGGIDGITLTIGAGETCAIIGPSGCGKTTLLHCLAGLIVPDGGSFRIGSDSGTGVGLVQQRDALFPWLTVEQNVHLGLRGVDRRRPADVVRGYRARRNGDAPRYDGHRREEYTCRLFSVLGIEALRSKYPDQLSGGERQRVSIARTLVSRPEVLLLDEPSSALDAFTRESLQDLLLALQREYTFTTLSVTHHIEEALFLAERVVVMGRGHIAATLDNPLYPDPEARTHKRFYEQAVELRRLLAEVVPRA